jgi:hypothetical protein
MKDMLSDLIVYCTNKDAGCSEKLRYEQLAKHQTDCKYQQLKCKGCLQSFYFDALKAHEPTCPDIKIWSQCCDKYVKRRELETHTEATCDGVKVWAACCEKYLLRRILKIHNAAQCRRDQAAAIEKERLEKLKREEEAKREIEKKRKEDNDKRLQHERRNVNYAAKTTCDRGHAINLTPAADRANQAFTCKGCSVQYNSISWSCKTCSYHLCPKCKPYQLVKNRCMKQHPLTDHGGSFNCDCCLQRYPNAICKACLTCNFTVCQNCHNRASAPVFDDVDEEESVENSLRFWNQLNQVLQPNHEEEKEQQQNISFAIVQPQSPSQGQPLLQSQSGQWRNPTCKNFHLLSITTLADRGYNEFSCDNCSGEFFAVSWHCAECRYDLCNNCQPLPFYKNRCLWGHRLDFTNSTTYRCDRCFRHYGDREYKCTRCDFDLCVKCHETIPNYDDGGTRKCCCTIF